MFVGKRIQIKKDVQGYGGHKGTIKKENRPNIQDPATLGRGSLWHILLDGTDRNLMFYSDQIEPLPEETFACPHCGATVKVQDRKLERHEIKQADSGLLMLCEGSFLPIEVVWEKK